MEENKEKLHQQFRALLKQRKEENDALRKIISALERKELKSTKENKARK